MQLNLFTYYQSEKLLNDLFTAYFDARKNKRNTANALRFERNFESNIFKLHEEIVSGNYKTSPGICFVVDKPVKREIFAADFRDRIVHHLLFNYLSPVYEKLFIHDSYSCRKGKGTHYGVKRIDHFIRSCSQNYKKDCYILKLDIKGYFMSIDKDILLSKAEKVLMAARNEFEVCRDLLEDLLKEVIFNDPTKNSYIKGNKSDWQGLPVSKSIFNAAKNTGLPIGNLTSQLFGNVYLNEFDHFVKRDLAIKYYGRYVDDFILVHQSRDYLKLLIPEISDFLKAKLQLTLHPKKIYLQHFSKGVNYLGTFIKPHRIYIANRAKANFFDAIQKQNILVRDHKPTQEEKEIFLSSINSYLGIMKHYKTYKARKHLILKNLSGWWWNHIALKGGYAKFALNKQLVIKKQKTIAI
jgi:RNA-directed DNA polymerase